MGNAWNVLQVIVPLMGADSMQANEYSHSTLKPSCFSDYNTGDEAVLFFQTAVRVFQVRLASWMPSMNLIA